MDGLGACGRALILPPAGAQNPGGSPRGTAALRMGLAAGGSGHYTRAHPSSVRTPKAQASHCLGFGWPGLRPLLRRGVGPLCLETRSLATRCP